MNVKNDAKKIVMQIIAPPRRIRHLREIRVLNIQKQDLTLVSCSNVVMKINAPGVRGYFTECRSHLPLEQYISRLVDDYFDMICADDSGRQDKECILAALGDDRRRRKLISSCLDGASAGTNYAQFLQSGDANPADMQQRIESFVVRYLRPHLIQHDAHKFLPYGRHQTAVTNKVLATEAVATLIGAEELIPHAEYVKLEIQGLPGRGLFGIFMEEAKGVCAMDIPPEVRRQKLTGKLQRALIRLNLLDIICHDMDHSPNNYNVYMDEDGMLEGVHAFDNNDISAFPLRKEINFGTYKNCACITSDNGLISRPAVDNDIAQKIMLLQKPALCSAISPYIGPLQAEFTWKRIRHLQKAIALTRKAQPEIFLDACGFDDDTLSRELSGAYGKTYLISLLEDCKYRR